MKLLSKRINRIQALITPLINVGGSKEVTDEFIFTQLKAAQELLDTAFLAAENPQPPLFDVSDWECSRTSCDYIVEQADGAPHRCPKCLNTNFVRSDIIIGDSSGAVAGDEPPEEEDGDDSD